MKTYDQCIQELAEEWVNMKLYTLDPEKLSQRERVYAMSDLVAWVYGENEGDTFDKILKASEEIERERGW